MKKSLRPIKINGNTAVITLTKGYECVVDTDQLHLIQHKPWRAHICGDHVYAVTWRGMINGENKMLYMHRVLSNAPDDKVVDHANRDTLDNRLLNLRICTQSQNQQNKVKGRRNKSGFKGVWWCKQHKAWRSQISANGKSKSLGLHKTKELAHEAYKAASIELHGEYARH